MRICLVLEGSYPYVHGGVSTWMHAYIQAMPQQEFALWVIGAKAQDRGKFVYELPPNVKEVEEVFLDDALRLHGERQAAGPVYCRRAYRLAGTGTAGQPGLGCAVPSVSGKRRPPALFFAESGFYGIVQGYLPTGVSLCGLCGCVPYHALDAAAGALPAYGPGAESGCLPCDLHRLRRPVWAAA